MLKSIVNGAEHDIISIPMKGKNLLNLNRAYSGLFTTNTTKWMNGAATVNLTGTTYAESEILGNAVKVTSKNPGYGASFLIEASPNTTYTVSFETDKTSSGSWGAISDRDINGTVISTAAIQGKSATFKTHSNCVFLNVCFRFPPADGTVTFSKIMLNLGSTAFPYEPYGYQEGWEVRDNQNRIIWGREDELQTTTGNLLFKGYDLPIKVNSLLGNSVQNGTPSPDNVVVPEFCGVRTKNICPSATAETKTNNGITAISNGSGTYHVSGTATADADIRFNVQSFWIPQSIGNYHDGTFSMFNSAIYDNTAVKLAFYYQGTKLDDWGLTTLNKTSTTYSNMSEKDCDAIGFTVKSGVTVDFTISPEFTNDGVLPTEFEPYGYKIPFDNNGENLFDKNATNTNNGYVDGAFLASTGVATSSTAYFISEYIPVSAGEAYTLKYSDGTLNSPSFCLYNANKEYVSGNRYGNQNPVSFTVPDGISFMRFSAAKNAKNIIMLNSGSTPLPYSPYLNKTTPIYLGEVPTIRRIKKLVFDGTENWYGYTESSAAGVYRLELNGYLRVNTNISLSTHFKTQSSVLGTTEVNEKSVAFLVSGSGNNYMYIKYSDMADVSDFKSYLTTQYQNGTPVTIWYVLATPETVIVNEPLAKVGNYADELTEISVHNLSSPLYGIGDYKDILNLSTGVVTRNIRNLVLTGEEASWVAGTSSVYILNLPDVLNGSGITSCLCSHYNAVPNIEGNYSSLSDDCCSVRYNQLKIWFRDILVGGIDGFKSFLQQQYANGTPVIIWYVLSTPETETVTVPTGMTGEIEGYLTQVSTPTPTNRSVPKWNGVEETGGTYAVTVYTPPEIPTTTGQNTLTVETEKIHGLTNPLCGIGDYKDVLNLSTGVITRKVKKLVLTGEETFYKNSGDTSNYLYYFNVQEGSETATEKRVFCTHLPSTGSTPSDTIGCSARGAGSFRAIYINLGADIMSGNNNAARVKSYLAAQYAAGTPVTIWYVLDTPETETITVPYGLECSVEGYLTQSSTPTPSSPITPDSNGILESDGTYAVEVSLVPSNLTVKGHIKPIQ